ncbi:hypothetical protein [Kitasatospora mediocidica]|uniref:hypothetical protein n=1 Tax=Kitasatospora mediocidica TaxID=58352 RepID=UPI00055A5158|nr:hypothetical protein [Kitasatospora mediocidica]
MTDAWTGRKYKSDSNDVTEILSEPFKALDGSEWIGFQTSYIVGVTSLASFDGKIRIVEPKYAVGDKVIRAGGHVYTIEAASSKRDYEGDRPYLVVNEAGEADVIWESNIEGKVSE